MVLVNLAQSPVGFEPAVRTLYHPLPWKQIESTSGVSRLTIEHLLTILSIRRKLRHIRLPEISSQARSAKIPFRGSAPPGIPQVSS